MENSSLSEHHTAVTVIFYIGRIIYSRGVCMITGTQSIAVEQRKRLSARHVAPVEKGM